MEILDLILTTFVSALQWLWEGLDAAISDSRYWGGLIIALVSGWILGRVWPRRETWREAVEWDGDDFFGDDWDVDDEWDEDDWDEDEEWHEED
jgi:hypothetical protein